jgi:hypothetical protein
MKREFTNIPVTVPDCTELLKQATEQYRQENPQRPITGFRTAFGSLGYVTTKTGDLYVIDRDGTGPEDPVTDNDPLELNLYPEFAPNPDGSTSVAMMPAYAVALKKSDILAMPITGESEDLSEFIRMFGRRLEENFKLWKDKLTPLL